jgi:hypothetical protein
MNIQTRLSRIETALRPPEESSFIFVLRVDPSRATEEQEAAFQREVEAAAAIGKSVCEIRLVGLSHEDVRQSRRHPRSGKRAAEVCQSITKEPNDNPISTPTN